MCSQLVRRTGRDRVGEHGQHRRGDGRLRPHRGANQRRHGPVPARPRRRCRGRQQGPRAVDPQALSAHGFGHGPGVPCRIVEQLSGLITEIAGGSPASATVFATAIRQRARRCRPRRFTIETTGTDNSAMPAMASAMDHALAALLRADPGRGALGVDETSRRAAEGARQAAHQGAAPWRVSPPGAACRSCWRFSSGGVVPLLVTDRHDPYWPRIDARARRRSTGRRRWQRSPCSSTKSSHIACR